MSKIKENFKTDNWFEQEGAKNKLLEVTHKNIQVTIAGELLGSRNTQTYQMTWA